MVAPRGIRPPSLSFRSAPAPRAPRGLPPLSALPLTPAPPGSLCSGSVAGSGDVATRRRRQRRSKTQKTLGHPRRRPQHFALKRGNRLRQPPLEMLKSSTSAAPAPTTASHWRRAAASRRTARRSLAACLRSGTTFCRRASTWPCARSWGAIRGGGTRKWTIAPPFL